MQFPEKLVPLWTDFYQNYKGAVLSSGLKDESFVAEVQSAIADRVLHQFMEPYKFPSYHTRILGEISHPPLDDRSPASPRPLQHPT